MDSTRASRITRLLRLAMLIQNSNGLTIQDLIHQLQISRRTLFRDMKCLSDIGLKPICSNRGEYRMDTNMTIPTTDLSTSEILGLLMVHKYALKCTGHPLFDRGVDAINKLLNQVTPTVRDACKEIVDVITVDSDRIPQMTSNTKKHFLTMMRMINDNGLCRINLTEAPIENTTSFNFVPQELHLQDDGYYVNGEAEPSGRKMSINLEQIVSINDI